MSITFLYIGRASRNTDCDYSSAYVTLYTDGGLIGHGMTFTIGRGTDIVSAALHIECRMYMFSTSRTTFRCSGSSYPVGGRY